MKWKRILRTGIIIYTFFMGVIECRTYIEAASCIENKINNQNNQARKLGEKLESNKEVLTNCKANDKIDQVIKVFSGDFDTGALVYTEYFVENKCGETDEELFTRLLKIQPDQEKLYIIGIPHQGEIKSISINPQQDMLVIDMTEAYDAYTYGSLGEYLAIQSLVDTLTDYYQVDKAIVSVEGVPYSSGHILFEKQRNKRSISASSR